MASEHEDCILHDLYLVEVGVINIDEALVAPPHRPTRVGRDDSRYAVEHIGCHSPPAVTMFVQIRLVVLALAYRLMGQDKNKRVFWFHFAIFGMPIFEPPIKVTNSSHF